MLSHVLDCIKLQLDPLTFEVWIPLNLGSWIVFPHTCYLKPAYVPHVLLCPVLLLLLLMLMVFYWWCCPVLTPSPPCAAVLCAT